MVNTPDMYSELIEAINEHFKDYPDIKADIYLYLGSLEKDEVRTKKLSNGGFYELKRMGRCDRCGEKLQPHHMKQIHDELDGNPVEEIVEYYCPNCDMFSE